MIYNKITPKMIKEIVVGYMIVMLDDYCFRDEDYGHWLECMYETLYGTIPEIAKSRYDERTMGYDAFVE